MKFLTASDRESLIRLASSLPKGDKQRRAILAGLKKVSAEWPKVTPEAKSHPFYQNLSAFTSAVEEFTTEFSKAFNPKKVKVTNLSKRVYYFMTVAVQPKRGESVAEISFQFNSDGLKVRGWCKEASRLPPAIPKEFERNPRKAGKMFANFCSSLLSPELGVLRGTEAPNSGKSPTKTALNGARLYFAKTLLSSAPKELGLVNQDMGSYDVDENRLVFRVGGGNMSTAISRMDPADKLKAIDAIDGIWKEVLAKFGKRFAKLGIRDVTRMPSRSDIMDYGYDTEYGLVLPLVFELKTL